MGGGIAVACAQQLREPLGLCDGGEMLRLGSLEADLQAIGGLVVAWPIAMP